MIFIQAIAVFLFLRATGSPAAVLAHGTVCLRLDTDDVGEGDASVDEGDPAHADAVVVDLDLEASDGDEREGGRRRDEYACEDEPHSHVPATTRLTPGGFTQEEPRDRCARSEVGEEHQSPHPARLAGLGLAVAGRTGTTGRISTAC